MDVARFTNVDARYYNACILKEDQPLAPLLSSNGESIDGFPEDIRAVNALSGIVFIFFCIQGINDVE